MSMKLDHSAVNAIDLDEEPAFFTEFLGLSLLRMWPDKRQAYMGAEKDRLLG